VGEGILAAGTLTRPQADARGHPLPEGEGE
jgi:hypothetical protein